MSFRGRLLNRRIPRPALGATALGLALALSASTVQQVAYADDRDPGRQLPGVQDMGDPVKGTKGKVKKRPDDPARKAAVKRLDAAAWPGQGRAEITVGEAGSTSPTEVKAGSLPVSATAVVKKAGAKAAETPAKIAVEVLDPKRATELGVSALLEVTRADETDKDSKVRLNVDYSAFAEGFGGNYGARLRLVELPACAALATPGSKACPEQPKVLPAKNDIKAGTLTADVTATPADSGPSTMAADGPALLAVAAGPSSAQGTYKATALSPSSSWNVAPSSGGFSWSYPLRTVPTPGGLVPTAGLGYSSQSADGRTATTNNQGSWIGEGFSYDPGYIERRYKPCSDDGHTGSGEQCWAFENATILLNGSSAELIKDDTTGKWHLSNDDGSKVEKLTGATNGDNDGEYWRITTSEGTEYYFGQNRLQGWTTGKEETNSTWTAPVFGDDSGEPCYNSTFANAHCQQAWRWSLDYVKDTHGNVMSYFYERETNYYALNGKTDVNGTAYHRGGYLKRIDYGQSDGQVYAAKAPARVTFTTAERCLPTSDFDCAESKRTKANAAYWPDVPVDQECKAATKCTTGQTFWTTKRLTGITTQMRKDATTYQDVDAWTLTHLFTDNGDDSKTLWLSKIDHEGRVGTAAKLPSVELFGEQLANRVDAIGDNIAPFYRYRLSAVLTETGAKLDINYASVNCTKSSLPAPGESTKRCYPVKWAPPGYLEPTTDWFHKYVVAEITDTDRTGGSDKLVTRYDYTGNAAWRKAEPDGITEAKYLTWGGWQGYDKVSVTSGTADKQSTRVDYTYLQGMDGDKDSAGGTRSVKVKDSKGTEYTDSKEFAGHELEAATYDGAKVVSRVINQPWKHNTATQTRSWGTSYAVIAKPRVTRGFSLLSNGTWRETKSHSTYDTDTRTGRVVSVNDLGDLADANDDSCTRTWYADNAAKNILSLPRRSEALSVNCDATADHKTQVLADERTSYDGGAYGTAPTKGDATTTERLTKHDGTTATYQTTGKTGYDAFGRISWQQDAKQIGTATKTSTAYTDVNGLISSTKLTNALGHITTTDFAPAWGLSSGQTDPNGKRTDLAYDALGRLTSVWLPDRQKAQTPSIKYSYNVRRDKPVAIKTEKVEIDGSYGTEYELFDGLLRGRQIQTEGPNGTRMVADSWYDGTGKVKKTNATYNAAGAPSDELLVVHDGEVGAQSLFEYDGLGRSTAEAFAVSGFEKWRSKTAYDGEKTHIDPPTGGIATTSIADAQGRTSALWHYHGDRPDALLGYDETKYTYTRNGQLQTVTDDKNNVWRYEYDQLNRKTKSIDPDAGTSRTEYDELDRPVTSYDARNKRVSTVYDGLSRPVSTWEGEPTTGTKLTETRYDQTGWLGHAYASLRYTSPTEYFATVTQSMDAFYRPLKTAYAVPTSQGALAGNYVFTNSYNRDGTAMGVGLPAAGGLAAEALAYGYDALQRPTTMTGTTSGTTPYVANTVYSDKSHVLQLQLYAGSGKRVTQNFEYEKGTDRLKSSSVDIVGGTAPVKQTGYSYDQVGNVLSISDTANTATPDVQCFGYDTGRRLKDAWTPLSTAGNAAGTGTAGVTEDSSSPQACAAAPGASALGGPAPYWKSWTVDSIGNRTAEVNHDVTLNATKDVTRTYTYGGAGTLGDGPHQVTKVVEKTPTGDRQSTYEYDDSGNTTKRVIGGDAQTIEWDALGKPAKIKDTVGETSFLYDSGGDRVLRKDSKATTVYLPGMELSLAAGSSTVKATRYYSFAGQTVAVRTSDNKLSFLAADHHGTGEVSIDSATGSVSQRRFDPYGVARGNATGTYPGEKGFVGGTIDASTGLTHIGARSYDAQLGKFISVDPLIDFTSPQQINGYAYADNSPVTLSDPSGLMRAPNDGDSFCKGGWNECGPGPGPKVQSKEEKAVSAAEYTHYQAQRQYDSAKKKTVQAAKALVEIVKDELGINAALDCISSGDFGSCGETILNIVGAFAGGIAGKVLAKYGLPWKWEQGAKLLKRITGLADDLVSGAMDVYKTQGKLDKSGDALAGAKAQLTKKSGCPVKKHSFLPGTKVLAANGKTKKIEDVELGDKLIVTDPETGKTTVREVAGTIVTEDDKHFVDLTIAIGKGDDNTSLISTTTHPFWVVSENAWIDAGNLKPGMTLRTADGTTVTLESSSTFDERQRTYDLTLTDIHTYYVLAGETPVLVHNSNGKGCEVGGSGISARNENAGDIGNYTDGQKTRDPASQWYHEMLSNDELLGGINKAGEGDGILVSRDGTILGGHHRKDELLARIRDGRIDPNTKIRIDVYDGD